jgi:hypothetical protein
MQKRSENESLKGILYCMYAKGAKVRTKWVPEERILRYCDRGDRGRGSTFLVRNSVVDLKLFNLIFFSSDPGPDSNPDPACL